MTDYKQLFEEYLKQQCFTSSLAAAIDYVIQNGGNRIRPQMVLAWCDACGGKLENALPLALAVEFGHTMSLIHDDLPCMDNATERRGKQCLHLVTSESTAILCGDKLLAMVFETIVRSDLNTNQKLKAIEVLSRSACDMADGQNLELTTEHITLDTWQEIHKGKTASLLAASCVLGVIAANGSDADISRAQAYGFSLGMAYQLLDDIRDHDGVSTVVDVDAMERIFATYTNKCYLGMATEPYRFLTKFVRRVLS